MPAAVDPLYSAFPMSFIEILFWYILTVSSVWKKAHKSS